MAWDAESEPSWDATKAAVAAAEMKLPSDSECREVIAVVMGAAEWKKKDVCG